MKKEMTRTAILGAVVIGVIGLGTLILGVSTLGRRLKAPFRLLPTGALTGANFSLTGNTAETLASATKDTDQDGLADSVELQAYNTSPFLPDSDSDGTSDKEEVQKGTDPNCPEGKDCRANLFPSQREAQEKTLSQNLYESAPFSKTQDVGSVLKSILPEGALPPQMALPENPSAEIVRKLLIAAGMDQELLKKFSDEQLIKLYQETLKDSATKKPEAP